jgi:hypothetical protein
MPFRLGEAEATGVPSGAGLGTPIVAGRGEDDQGITKAQKGERRRCDAPVADETTPRVVDFIEYEAFLATTGWGNGRWDGRELEMP